MKAKPDLSFWKLWNISFGFFGVQIAYALQSANISRIFATLGADPHSLSYFWILPPLAGIIVQPLVGAASDKTWTRQDMDTLRTTYPIFIHRFTHCRTGDVSATQCRKLWHGSQHSHDIRPFCTHVSGYLHQHGHATVQNDGRRHGERKAERSGLLHPKFPV